MQVTTITTISLIPLGGVGWLHRLHDPVEFDIFRDIIYYVISFNNFPQNS